MPQLETNTRGVGNHAHDTTDCQICGYLAFIGTQGAGATDRRTEITSLYIAVTGYRSNTPAEFQPLVQECGQRKRGMDGTMQTQMGRCESAFSPGRATERGERALVQVTSQA